jgi:parallel beta-helix repeat protein
MKKTALVLSSILCMILPLLLICFTTEVRVLAQNTVYIRADGSVDPETAPISTFDNVTYTLTGNINEQIVIQRNNITLDGAAYTVDGSGVGRGLDLNSVQNVIIKNVSIEGFYYGVQLNFSSQITLTESNITMNAYDGVRIIQSSKSNFSRNIISNNGNDGLKLLSSSSNNIITENTITLNNDDGIQLSDSPQNKISGNTVSQNNDVGIYALNSSTTTVIGNTVMNNRLGLEIDSSLSNDVDGNTFNSNTLDGISLSSSPDNMFKENTINNNYDGVYAYQSSRNVFFENEIQGNDEYGIWLDFSSNGTLSLNNITGNNKVGVYVRYSSGNIISDNTVRNSNGGISLSGSTSNSILGNLLANNNNGLTLAFSSTNNHVYHNNFVNNTQQASSTSAVTWTNGLEGNYWSDYSGSDVNFDGIGDSPYVIGAGNDVFPLMGMFHAFNTSLGYRVNVISNSTIDDFNYTRLPGNISIIMHVSNSTSSQTTGLCRVTIPHSLMTEPYNVTINGTQPNYANYAVYDNATHRWIYFNYNHSNLEVIIQGIETTPPEISIISPGNMTYATSDVPLVFTVNETTSWMGYALDGQENVTISGNTTLMGLSDGPHNVIVFANDTFGNIGASARVYFSVDTLSPTVVVLSPQNMTYQTGSIMLTFNISEPVSWMGYSLNAQANVTVAGNTTLSGLPDGSHSIIVYANDTAGNMGASDIVYFTIARAPEVTILSPQNMTYATANVALTFTVNETASWMGYSLDGQANVTIVGNTTLTGLSDGAHNVLVFANDTFGNMASSSLVYFSVDTTLPQITILSPLNQTYQTGSIPLTFTVNKLTSWIGYSLNGQPNATIVGNTTLLGLPDGSYSIVVYANDTGGNMGASETIYFTIGRAPEITILSPEEITYATSDVPLVFTVNETTSWMGYSLDSQAYVTILGNTTLLSLSDGIHNIVVSANDTFGNMASSSIVYFSVDTTPPSITILSPLNQTYQTGSIMLTFTLDESTSWIGYRLDSQDNMTILGNTTLLDLTDGNHHVIVYATDTVGNLGSSTVVYFSVDTTPPDIIDVSQYPPEDNVQPYDQVNVNATVIDNFGVSTVTLNYTTNNGTWFSMEMNHLEGNVWNATIPGFPYGTTVNYTITAVDAVGNSVSSEGAYTIYVIPEFSPYVALLLLMTATLIAVTLTKSKRIRE